MAWVSGCLFILLSLQVDFLTHAILFTAGLSVKDISAKKAAAPLPFNGFPPKDTLKWQRLTN
ncbi:hypothetical protein [Virgibacillus kimchii]